MSFGDRLFVGAAVCLSFAGILYAMASDYDNASEERRRNMWKIDTYAFIGRYTWRPVVALGAIFLTGGIVVYLAQLFFGVH